MRAAAAPTGPPLLGGAPPELEESMEAVPPAWRPHAVAGGVGVPCVPDPAMWGCGWG